MRLFAVVSFLACAAAPLVAQASDELSPEFVAWWKRAIGAPGSPPDIDGIMFRIIRLNGLDSSKGSIPEVETMIAENSVLRPGQLWVWKLGSRWRVSANMTESAFQDIAWNDSAAWGATSSLLTIVPQTGIENSPFRYDALGGSRLGEIYSLLTLGLYQQLSNGISLHPRMASDQTWEIRDEGKYPDGTLIVVEAKGSWNPQERLGQVAMTRIIGKNRAESGEEVCSASEWLLVPRLQLYIAKRMSFQRLGSPSVAPYQLALLETKEFDRSEMDRLVATPRRGDIDPLRGNREFRQIDDMTSKRWSVHKFDATGAEIANSTPVVEAETGSSLRQTIAYIVGGVLLLALGVLAIGRLRAQASSSHTKGE